jgi:glycosyltransferase involved in cell wall biosynthesis
VKILCLTEDNKEIAGGRVAFMRVVHELAKRHEITLIANAGATERIFPKLKNEIRLRYRISQRLKTFRYITFLLRVIKNYDSQAILCAQGFMAVFYLLIARMTRRPVAIYVYDIPSMRFFTKYARARPWKYFWVLWRWMSSYAFLRHFDNVLLLSDAVKVDSEKRFNLRNASVVGAPITYNRENNSQYKMVKRWDNLVLVLNRIEQNKLPLFVLDVAQLLKTYGYRIVWIGDGSQRKLLEEEIKKRQLPITLLGNIDDATKTHYLVTCKCLLYATNWEGFGMPPAEALAYGTPVVATDIPVLRQIYGDVVTYVKSPEEAVNAIINASPGSPIFLEKYSTENVTTKIETTLMSLVKRSQNAKP